MSISTPFVGTLFVSEMSGPWMSYNGTVISAFYHPTKRHTATTVGKNGTKRSVAEAG